MSSIERVNIEEKAKLYKHERKHNNRNPDRSRSNKDKEDNYKNQRHNSDYFQHPNSNKPNPSPKPQPHNSFQAPRSYENKKEPREIRVSRDSHQPKEQSPP